MYVFVSSSYCNGSQSRHLTYFTFGVFLGAFLFFVVLEKKNKVKGPQSCGKQGADIL